MKKVLILLAGVLAQACLGSIYAWSVIGNSLAEEFALAAWQTQTIYGLSIGVFAFGTIFTGRLLDRWGPRRLVLVSGGLFVMAYLAASFSGGSFPILVLALGILMGIAIAFGYVVPLSTAVAWFPEAKGTVTGLAVMGFGGGAIVVSWFLRELFARGWRILPSLRIMGIAGGVILIACSIIQAFPPTTRPAARRGSWSDVASLVRSREYWILAASMFLATTGGLVLIGMVVEVATAYRLASVAALALSLITLGNAAGRILWGAIIDKLGDRTITASFAIMALSFLSVFLAPGRPVLFLFGVVGTGLQFGASLVVFAAYVSKHHGPAAIARMYPYIFIWYGLGALVGPPLGGLAVDVTGSHRLVALALVVLPVIGALTFAPLTSRRNLDELSTAEDTA